MFRTLLMKLYKTNPGFIFIKVLYISSKSKFIQLLRLTIPTSFTFLISKYPGIYKLMEDVNKKIKRCDGLNNLSMS